MLSREVRFLIAATLLHAAIPFMAWLAGDPAPTFVARSSGAYREVEIEVQPVAPPGPEHAEERATTPPAPEEPEARPRDDAAPPVPGRTARRERRDLPERAPQEAPVEPGGGPVPPEAPAVPAPSTGHDEYGGPPSADGRPGVAGLGGVPVWQLPGVLPERAAPPPAPTAPPAPRETPADKAGEVLRQAMRDRDKTIGLDLPAAGTIASVVADAVRAAADAPATVRVVFEVHLSGAGLVLGVRARSSSAGAAAVWAQVAREAAALLAGRALAMTAAFAKGAKVYVTVSSSERMPSGATSSGIQHQGAGFGFDISDIGARKHRVIQSSFHVEALD
ncbi:hypothetical protein WMF31_33640 [Sorangium sp. So ce1036]|uniref:hypothetical protein n=1 Tax=Sorangium sp. So ce1036 TaxID=3133328 RepID=UPI003F105055